MSYRGRAGIKLGRLLNIEVGVRRAFAPKRDSYGSYGLSEALA